MASNNQKYSQYIDNESGVVKKPEGPDWDDPFGDGVWRTSWFYSSLLVMKAKDQKTFEQVCQDHELSEELVERFFRYFRDHCAGDDYA